MVSEAIILFFLFAALYFEVFVLLTFLENRKEIKDSESVSLKNPENLPSVTIIVPCYNEEKTIVKTVESLLEIDYPKNKFRISIVDDGSKDRTWDYIQMYEKHPQIETHRKKNGGKYTAMNYAIKRADTDLVGCLDADSFVSTDALRKMVKKFIENPEVMAVAPAMKIYKPDSLMRKLQYVEYIYGIFMKKLYSFLDAIHVTPGPFSIYRRELFEEIGYFRHAHNTEDMEITMRMQKFGKKIENCHDAIVYTVGPKTFKKLYKQRLRWTYGFIRNTFDYRDMLFNSKTNIGYLTLPFGILGLAAALTSFSLISYNLMNFGINKAENLALSNWSFNFHKPNLDPFFISTSTTTLIALLTISIMISMILLSEKITGHKLSKRNVAIYLLIYPLVSITWIAKSVWNAVLDRGVNWR